jgi:adenine-specific DNA-methyltransferase
MRYFGSKGTTVEQLYSSISEQVPSGSFCDPFGGVGVVGAFFKSKGYRVVSGDILTFAHYFQIAKIQQEKNKHFEKLCTELRLDSPSEIPSILTQVSDREGWFVEEYSVKRQFFTVENAKRIEACRDQISQWWNYQLLTYEDRAILLASLINCMDRIANTAGTYYAHLKKWHRKALLPFNFEMISSTTGPRECRCFLTDAASLVARASYDILYLDPPYNERDYSGYYHLPETVVLGGTPDVHGKSGIPNGSRNKSDFNITKHAGTALAELLRCAQFRLLAVHYADDGIIKPTEIRAILAPYGQISEILLQSKSYTVSNTPRIAEHRLYLVSRS